MENNIMRFLIFISSLALNKGSVLRVSGGYEAPAAFGRWHASLQNWSGAHVCGGAVVSAHHVVTAAHCVYGSEPEYIQAVIGTTNLNQGGYRYNVTAIIIHDKFDYHLKVNDIAILKIHGFFNVETVDFLELSSEHLNEGDPVILSGFGSQELHGETGPLMYALDLTVFSQETCKYAMRYTRDVYDEMFCTFSRIGEGTCHGDSGGPLIKDGKLVGVVSWGIPCAAGFPDVHTRLAPYHHWIRHNIAHSPHVPGCRTKRLH